MFQSTPSRRGRHLLPIMIYLQCFVSIHSLTQRETCLQLEKLSRQRVSIHSLTQRETEERVTLHWFSYSFNPLPHAEGDHAGQTLKLPGACFNPLPHAEGDNAGELAALLATGFNPLPHAEGDRLLRLRSIAGRVFQSTPSRRGRPGSIGASQTPKMFQSTPSRRGRRRPSRKKTEQSCFNPLPHAEGDCRY